MPAAVRPPAVAGLFYPGDPGELRETVVTMLAAAGPPPDLPQVKALIVPHAGFVYSGPVAATAYRLLAAQAGGIKRIVLLGPSHHAGFAGLALPGAAAFATPLGAMPLDAGLAAALEDLPQVGVLPRAHAREHSLEVQLPFLQVIFPGGVKLVALVVGDATPEETAAVMSVLWGGAETLLLISSDLSHYLPYATARIRDAQTAERIERCEYPLDPESACGAHPINGLLCAARPHGLRVRRLDLRNSGDTAGDHSRVVGYGAFALY